MVKEDCINYYPPGRDPEYCMIKDDVFLHCEECEKYKSKNTKTKADRLRAMTDEALAEYHTEMCGCPPGNDPIFCGMATIGCKGCWLNWLREVVT